MQQIHNGVFYDLIHSNGFCRIDTFCKQRAALIRARPLMFNLTFYLNIISPAIPWFQLSR